MKLTQTLMIGALLIGGNALANHHEGAAKDAHHSSVTFSAGSWMLSDTDKMALKKVVDEARTHGKIDQITVAAWSDKALPAKGQKLTDQDRELADKRASGIKDYLKTLDVSDVDTFNMAETSNWLARTFNTKDSELKSVFSKKGAELPMTDAQYHMIKAEGGPSEAVIFAELKK